MSLALAIISGICWTVVYLESIRVGLRDSTYAMPVFALGLNLAWEVLYFADGALNWSRYDTFGNTQTVINLVWALLDVGILWTFFRFGRGDWPHLGRSLVALLGVLALVVGAAVQGVLFVEFGPRLAPVYSAFAQNLLMSVLYVGMLLRRNSTAGQSTLIAVMKLLGTLAPTISMGFSSGFDPYVAVFGLLCLLFDALYLGALRQVGTVKTQRRPAWAGHRRW